jgi:hypothetical protein
MENMRTQPATSLWDRVSGAYNRRAMVETYANNYYVTERFRESHRGGDGRTMDCLENLNFVERLKCLKCCDGVFISIGKIAGHRAHVR